MDFRITFLLIVSLSCLLSVSNALPLKRRARSSEVQLRLLCKPAQNPNLCFDTIFPQIRGRFNYYKALRAEIVATTNQVHKSAGKIAAMLADPRKTLSMIDSLRTCAKEYADIVGELSAALRMVAKRQVYDVRNSLGGVISSRSTCDDQFTGNSSPLTADSQIIYDLTGNCLDIAAAIADAEDKRNGGNAAPVGPAPPNPCQHVIGTCS